MVEPKSKWSGCLFSAAPRSECQNCGKKMRATFNSAAHARANLADAEQKTERREQKRKMQREKNEKKSMLRILRDQYTDLRSRIERGECVDFYMGSEQGIRKIRSGNSDALTDPNSSSFNYSPDSPDYSS
ncbi:hypothetical protein niasHT_036641 [Heterodera trifolii]|uniref:C2H2-type domain-containing protein n=1 Tax=Heterodera trifolii TaxID=157864 RepID=A0ABD2I588_9BILA